MTASVMWMAVFLDWILGEPRRFHPLVGFGRCAIFLENNMNVRTDSDPAQKLMGSISVVLLVLLPVLLLIALLSTIQSLVIYWALQLIVLVFCLGHRSLYDHAMPISNALQANDELASARAAVAHIVSRDTDTMNETMISKAACESVLENGGDAVFSTLFWFAVLGAPGALAHRLSNTLDAMWGYKTPRYLHFGWAAARLDDLLNWPAARLVELTYALCGNTRDSLRAVREQRVLCDSPNGGPIMAAGAAAIGISIGGPVVYHGQALVNPTLGCGPEACGKDIKPALNLVSRGTILWLIVAAILTALISLKPLL